MIKYKKCSDLKRTFAFLCDIFFAALIAIILFCVPSLIYQQTNTYKNNVLAIETVQKESGLFKDGEYLDTYLENQDLTINEKSKILDDAIKNFYKNENFFNTNETSEYNERKKNAKVDGKNLFILVDGEYQKSLLEISDNEYYNFYLKEYGNFALPKLSSSERYIGLTNNILRVYLLMLILSVLISLFIVFYIFPLCFRRTRSTLGMKIFSIGLISNTGFALTFKEFTFRFLFLYLIELILGFFSFFLTTFISFLFMIISSKHEPLHDRLINSRAIDTTNSIIFLNEYDFNIKTLTDNKI